MPPRLPRLPVALRLLPVLTSRCLLQTTLRSRLRAARSPKAGRKSQTRFVLWKRSANNRFSAEKDPAPDADASDAANTSDDQPERAFSRRRKGKGKA
jgi:hypothetical protein